MDCERDVAAEASDAAAGGRDIVAQGWDTVTLGRDAVAEAWGMATQAWDGRAVDSGAFRRLHAPYAMAALNWRAKRWFACFPA